MRRTVLFSAVYCLTLVLSGWAQPPSSDSESGFQYERWRDYRVGVGDVIEIQVVGVPNLDQTVVVSFNGDISIHPVGTIHVADLSAIELEERIGTVLRDRDFVREAQVLAFVRDYRARRIYVSGEVNFPGEFIMSQNLSVMDAILLAGGLTPVAGRFAYIHRIYSDGAVVGPPPESVLENPEEPREGTRILSIDLELVKVGGFPIPDVVLEAGDALVVPRRPLEFYYVLGEVMQPLNYLYPLDRSLMVSQAIAGAGGVTLTAKISEGMLVRYDQAGNRQELQVDFRAILEGRQEDIAVLPNDIIFVPGSKVRTITEGYVNVANAMISQTAFRIGRHYQLPDRPEGREFPEN